jgi:uncharacterized protein YggE
MNIKTLLLAAFILVPLLTLSQAQPLVKKIEVNGEAEMEITPNEIHFRIVLKEYLDGRKKVEMNKLESQLVKALKAEDLADDDLTVESISGYNWNWKKQRSEEFLATKNFKLKVSDLRKMNDLLERLDQRGINSVSIASYTHSNLEQYQKELKLKALQNAKEKAAFLLSGIDETLGGVLEVSEINQPQVPIYRAQTMELASDSNYQSDLEFNSIKITAEIRAMFEIR